MNSCNRANDALAFLSRSKELAEADGEEASRKPNKGTKTRRQDRISRHHAATPSASLSDAATAGSDPGQIENSIHVARTHVEAKDELFEAYSKTFIDYCKHHGEAFEILILRSMYEISNFHTKPDKTDFHNFIIASAISQAEDFICHRKWERMTRARNHGGTGGACDFSPGRWV